MSEAPKKPNSTSISGGDEYTEQAVRAFMESGKHNGYVVPPEETPAPVYESATTHFPDLYPRDRIYRIPEDELDRKVEGLVRAMTLQEKADLLYVDGSIEPKEKGGTTMYGLGVARLGVPVMRQHDGPPGIRAAYETTSPPEPLCIANTFDPDTAYAIGRVYGEELVSIGSNMKLGAQLDVGRSPSWHRLKDIYGEDYFLVSEMGVAEVAGVQENGGMTMGKHMGCYNTVGDMLQTAEVDEQTLHTVYLQPFEQACKRSGLSSIMTSYNTMNGYFTASNSYMMKDVARDMWKWKGCFTTDAGGNKEFSVGLGTDVEMGLRFNTLENLRASLRAGNLTMDDVDNACRHALWCYGSCGYLNLVELDPDTGLAKDEPGRVSPIEIPESYWADRANGMLQRHNAVVTAAAEKGITLLKNERNALPLKQEETVAFIGYPAQYYYAGVGMERSYGTLEFQSTPPEALQELWGNDAKILSAVYDEPFGTDVPADVVFTDERCTRNGWVRTCGILKEDATPLRGFDAGFGPPKDPEAVDMPGFVTGSFSGIEPQLALRTGTKGYLNGPDGKALKNGQAYTWKGYLAAPADGEYKFVIEYIGGSASFAIFEDDTELGRCGGTGRPGLNYQWAYFSTTNDGTTTADVTVSLKAGKLYHVVVCGAAYFAEKDLTVVLSWVTPGYHEALKAKALAAAQQADTIVALVRAGGGGMPSFGADVSLPFRDKDMLLTLEKLAKDAGKKLVVVTYGGTPVITGDWIDGCDAYVCAFHPGQGGANALASLLSGKKNFSGKLCMTFPKRHEDTALTASPEITKERVGDPQGDRAPFVSHYTEHLNFGYRWNEETGIAPGFAFGSGLSYTTFSYSDLKVTVARNDSTTLELSLTVTNTGAVAGDEVVQVYLGAPEVAAYIHTSPKQLAAFTRTGELQPGEARTVQLTVRERDLSVWDILQPVTEHADGSRDKWVLAKGTRQVMVGAASDDIRLTAGVEI